MPTSKFNLEWELSVLVKDSLPLKSISTFLIYLEYDFEGNAVPIEITADTGATLQLSSDHHKKGSKSLKWQWTASANKLTWDLQSAAVQSERNGGIKMWIYNSNPSEKCLSVCIRERSSSSRKKSCFPISLNFQRWRAIWVAYREFRGCTSNSPTFNPTSNYNGWSVFRFVITAPSRSGSRGTLYFDLLRFERTVTRQTRDSVVPPLSYNRPPTAALRCTDCDKISAGFSVEDALAFHERKNFWQQIFRWSLVSPPDPQSTVATARLTDIRDKISRRLLNWYANESTTFTQIPRPDPIPNVFLTKRWYSLLKNIDTAHEEFQEFTTVVGGDRKLTSGLFSRNSKYGRRQTVDEEKKFSSILYLVLHPLALEYFIKSRSNEVDHAACEFAKIYTCTPNRNVRKNHVKEITGKDAELRAAFTSQYSPDSTIASSPHLPTCSGVSQACLDHVKAAINFVNEKRKEKILAIFDYIREQGFDEGSALGSNDHMPLGMSGFYHGAFLMKGELGATRLDYIIRTMKWYSDFGEIYQDPFEFKGTTADRVRTLMFFRLITVLVMPEGNDDQKKAKIRDMDALKSWINNALSINEGLGGLIKPDFTSFHHKTFYAGAYTPQALHTAALISYLLQGTAYELESEVRENVVNALKVFRIAAVHYSTPSSVGGRYPTYTKAILAEHVPGYAYLAANPSSTLPFTSLNTDLEEVSMFLRLYEHTTGTCDGPFNEELCKGKVDRKYYLNSLGSLEIMERVEALASSQAETSPEGHWCKQFGALSIHRRDDWAVTVKGFDKFVWDYESSNDENKYSMYASHGAMLIANSESALSSKDVENGWDWRKIPGTTVINAGFSNTLMPDEDRHYNGADDSMAGGVTLGGSTPSPRGIFGRNGVFGMRFVKPTYNAAYFSQVTFRFKKSVFFYDDVIVSLGSNIEYTAPPQRTDEVHTALFQDKMRTNTSPRTNPKIASADRCNDGGSANVKSSWGNAASVVLVDVNGNRYIL